MIRAQRNLLALSTIWPRYGAVRSQPSWFAERDDFAHRKTCLLVLLLLNLPLVLSALSQPYVTLLAAVYLHLLFGVLVVAVWSAETETGQIRESLERLRMSQSEYKILNNMSAGIMLVRASDGMIIHVNPAFQRMFDYGSLQLTGKCIHTVPEFPCPRRSSEQARKIRKRLRQHGRWSGEIRYVRNDGRVLYVHAKYSTLELSAFGQLWLLTYEDVTERKRREEARRKLEERLRLAEKRESLDLLAGGVAHSLNNLLTVIGGHVELALRTLGRNSPVHENLDAITQAAEQAAKLSGQMLELSGHKPFAHEHVNVSDLVGGMAPWIETSISKKAMLNYDLASELPRVEGGVGHLRRLVTSLITNGSEALGDGRGLICVSTGVRELRKEDLLDACATDELREGPYVCLEVSDTGCGMDERTRKRIFDPYFSTKLTGRGLGLAAAFGIARAHHGSMIVRSEPDKWTSVTVLLPCAEPPLELSSPGAGKGATGS